MRHLPGTTRSHAISPRSLTCFAIAVKQASKASSTWSCHTSTINGYAIEGHVPAADVKRLLATKPKAAGLAVPGMVMGSPGMEHGDHKEPYQVLLFDKAGKTKIFASY